jgi:hypothetical protein
LVGIKPNRTEQIKKHEKLIIKAALAFILVKKKKQRSLYPTTTEPLLKLGRIRKKF